MIIEKIIEKIIFSEGVDILEQVAQISCEYLMPESAEGKLGYISEKPGLVGVPA